jgi:hypothetical protein
LDEALGLQPYQRTSLEVKWLASAVAVFVSFETAAVLLGLLTGVQVCPKSIWLWGQEAGQRALAQVQAQLKALEGGNLPPEEARTAESEALPLRLGADGVMVPFRPEGGQPKGKTVWREVKVGILARLSTRMNKAGQRVTRLTQRRLVAVLGDIEALKPRLGLEAIRQGLRPRWSG